MRLIFIVFIFVSVGCASVSSVSDQNRITQERVVELLNGELKRELLLDVESKQDIFYISEQQKQDFLSNFHNIRNKNTLPNRRISRFLSQRLAQFSFHANTLTASQSLSNNQGNCLSLAILTKALADISNVDVKFELVQTPPVYQRSNGLLMKSQHIQTLLFDPVSSTLNSSGAFWQRYIRVDYYPTGKSIPVRRVDESEFLAMFYQNKATEALIQQDYSKAFSYAYEAIQIRPHDSRSINLLALVHSELDYKAEAEQLFKLGLESSSFEESYELLFNYRNLLKSQNRLTEVEAIEKVLLRFDNENPFTWIDQGAESLEQKQYAEAIRFYKKALEKASYLHQAHYGLAMSYIGLGQFSKAKIELQLAIEKATEESSKTLYNEKLRSIIGNQD